MDQDQERQEPQFIPYPTDRTSAFFDRAENADELVVDLKKHGFEEKDITILRGTAGLQALDPEGKEHGTVARVMRAIQHWLYTGDWELYEQAAAELREGHYLVTVLTKEETQKDLAAYLMRKHYGHDIKYFNSMYVEHITN
ncbi:MAG: hypothetical protein AB7O96_11525 [Pseudobdellovibrionaceae bacterium]